MPIPVTVLHACVLQVYVCAAVCNTALGMTKLRDMAINVNGVCCNPGFLCHADVLATTHPVRETVCSVHREAIWSYPLA